MDDSPTTRDEARRRRRWEREHSPARFYGRTTLGTLVPGSGLLLAGRRRWGGTLLVGALAAAVAVVVGYVVLGPVRPLLWLAIRPNAMTWLAVGLVAWGLAVAASVAYTGWLHRPAAGRTLARVLGTVWVGLLLAALLLPVGVAASYLSIQRGWTVSAFTQRPRPAGAADPDTTRVDPWEGIPRVNLLLLGSDSGPDRQGVRTDSMMVVSMEPQSGRTVLIGVPRNLQNVPFPASNPLSKLYPQGYTCGTECLLNAVWAEAELHRDLFPGEANPGERTTREVIAGVLGLKIDATVVVDMQGFADLVDALGGVDVTVRERIPTGGKVSGGQVVPGSITGWIEPGQQHLDGYHAMWFARSRATTDDFSRMRRQRCLLGAMIHQVNVGTLVRRYADLARATQENLTFDIPLEDVTAWIDLLERVQKGGRISSLTLSNLTIDPAQPDFRRIRALVADALTPRPTATATPPGTTTGPPTTSSSPTTTPPGGGASSMTPGGTSTTPGGTPTPGATTPPSDALTDLSDAC